MQLSRYVKIHPCRERLGYSLLFAMRRGASILLSDKALKGIADGTLSQPDRETLLRLGFLVSDLVEEKEEMRETFDRINRKRRRFNAIAVMNMECNLDCVYCFEGGLKGKRYMTRETAELLCAFVEREHIAKGESVTIDFYGGEPLLSHDLIRNISARLKGAAEARRVEYTFNLITNGTLLTRERVVELLPLGLSQAKVTVDGPRENHNRFRPFVSGAGSFDAIIQNVKACCDLIRIQFTGNYTQENYREFPRLLDYILAEGLTPDRLALVAFAPITGTMSEYGLPEFREGCDDSAEPWLIEASLFLREEILKRGFNTPKILPSTCMVEVQSDIVINLDGDIYKCPAFIGKKEFKVGGLLTGIKDYSESHSLGNWKNDECLECAYLPICFGGCRFLKLLRDGNMDGVDCRKAYLDAALEELVNQQIRYGLKSERN
jgi:uncharacterized protein